MSTYQEMDRLRKLARPLYLELCALGPHLLVYEDMDAPSGYRLEITGLRSLSTNYAERLALRIEEATPGLLRVLGARWDEDLDAIREEGRV